MTHSFPTRRSADLFEQAGPFISAGEAVRRLRSEFVDEHAELRLDRVGPLRRIAGERNPAGQPPVPHQPVIIDHLVEQLTLRRPAQHRRSEEHTSELQSLMRISYAVFCLNKK